MVESGVSLATMCKFLCMMAVSCLPVSEKGVIIGRILISICGVYWDNRQLQLWVRAFLCFNDEVQWICSGK